MDKCYYCKKKYDWNPPFILRVLSSVGYTDIDFCSKECLKEYLNKKSFFEFRRE
jgi:hypothetical protein